MNPLASSQEHAALLVRVGNTSATRAVAFLACFADNPGGHGVRREGADVAMQSALAALAARHETLRTRFVERDGQFLQAVLPPDNPAAAPALATRRPTASGDARELRELVASASTQPYRLLDGSVPLRAVLVPGGLRGEDLLLMCMHHILRCGTQSVDDFVLLCLAGQG